MKAEVPLYSEEASAQTPFFVFDPIDYKFFYFPSIEDCQAFIALEVLPFYRDDRQRRFCSDVQWVTIGRISHVVECDDNHMGCGLVQLDP